MALVWSCDRCHAISNAGTVDDPPEGWVVRSMPVRGSEGARSSMDQTLCYQCDEHLYRWLTGPVHGIPEHVVQLLHEVDGQLGLAVHRHEGDRGEWKNEASALIARIREVIHG